MHSFRTKTRWPKVKMSSTVYCRWDSCTRQHDKTIRCKQDCCQFKSATISGAMRYIKAKALMQWWHLSLGLAASKQTAYLNNESKRVVSVLPCCYCKNCSTDDFFLQEMQCEVNTQHMDRSLDLKLEVCPLKVPVSLFTTSPVSWGNPILRSHSFVNIWALRCFFFFSFEIGCRPTTVHCSSLQLACGVYPGAMFMITTGDLRAGL